MEMSSHPLGRTKWVLVDVIPAVAMIGHQVRMEKKVRDFLAEQRFA